MTQENQIEKIGHSVPYSVKGFIIAFLDSNFPIPDICVGRVTEEGIKVKENILLIPIPNQSKLGDRVIIYSVR